MKKQAITLSTLLLLHGCSGNEVKPSPPPARAMSDYDINTIYPPREDIFIGDIYANIYTPNCNATLDNNECTFTSIRIARIPIDNISKMISNQHNNTQSFAPEENGCQLKEITETDQEGDTKKYLPSKECFTRDTTDPSDAYQHLKQIAFPNFYKHTGSSSQASTAILAKILPKAGIGINNIKEYSVAIPTARYYSVNPFEMLDALQNLPPEQSQKLQQVKDYKEMVCSQCKTKIFIPYQIYYTRELDITYKGEFFANRKYSQTRTPNEPRVLYIPPTDTNDSTNTSSTALIEENSFGVTTTLSHASTGDIGVRQVFDTPMAIGYKGFVYDDHEEIKNKLAAHHKSSYEQPTVTASEKSPSPSVVEERSDESFKAADDAYFADSGDGTDTSPPSSVVEERSDESFKAADDAYFADSGDGTDTAGQEAADADHSRSVTDGADTTEQGTADADHSESVTDGADTAKQQTDKLFSGTGDAHAASQ
ncbi:hypothetical protein E0E50_15800 [Azotobacter chroococcum subsp. isscasi]|uniref:hypothetical protein n=1 Tax=Azotobacter chroococcum TaxID=353 RepID=UPI00103FA68A|nr:hypothetical protein [Azotobacter chroococcum]TBW08023.1 hypothetical protein E0E50_15800 [Azotobacter chroococcum subsp. isscasi]